MLDTALTVTIVVLMLCGCVSALAGAAWIWRLVL